MIKRLFFATFFGLFITQGNTQVFQKNNVIIDAYYGFPNWFTVLNDNQYNGLSMFPNNVSGVGPLGIRGEFMITDMIGIGLDAGMNQSKIVEEYTYYDANSGNNVLGTIESSTQKIGGIFTFNFHPIKAGNKFDLAVTAGLGFGKRTYQTTFSNPELLTSADIYYYDYWNTPSTQYNFFQNGDNFLGAITLPIPLAFRIGMTMRYFFTPNFGLNFGVGAAHGGIINGGVSFKF
ncbi:MAG: hypothetical protein WC044_12510 [Crocinitomicaceae bacterium]